MRTGIVRSYNPASGFGVIEATDHSHTAVFSKDSLYTAGIHSVDEGDRMEYELRENDEMREKTAHCLRVMRTGLSSISAYKKKVEKKR